MAKVKTLVDFHDKTQIDEKTGTPKLVPAGTTLDISRERQAELGARGITPKPGEVAEEAAAAAPSNK